MNKKGQLIWEDIKKWIIAILFLVVIVIIIFLNKEKALELLDKLKLLLRFGV